MNIKASLLDHVSRLIGSARGALLAIVGLGALATTMVSYLMYRSDYCPWLQNFLLNVAFLFIGANFTL